MNQTTKLLLKELLTKEEYIEVTEFLCIYDEDNDILLEDDCSDGEYYQTIDKLTYMLDEMFVDNLSVADKVDFEQNYFIKHVELVSNAIVKLRQYLYEKELADK